jgi:hypothetical protein
MQPNCAARAHASARGHVEQAGIARLAQAPPRQLVLGGSCARRQLAQQLYSQSAQAGAGTGLELQPAGRAATTSSRPEPAPLSCPRTAGSASSCSASQQAPPARCSDDCMHPTEAAAQRAGQQQRCRSWLPVCACYGASLYQAPRGHCRCSASQQAPPARCSDGCMDLTEAAAQRAGQQQHCAACCKESRLHHAQSLA